MSGITVKITPAGNVRRALQRTIAQMPSTLSATLVTVGEVMTANLKAEAPGKMDASISANLSPAAVEIGSSWGKATLVEKGRRPGKPPPANVLGGRAAQTIARSGTKGTKTFERARLRARASGQLARVIQDGAERMGRLR